MNRKGRSFGKTAVLTLLFWIGIGLWVLNTTPDGIFSVVVFFLLAFWALWLPLSVLFVSGRRGLLITLGILGTLGMKPLGVFSLLSVAAWWAIIAVVEVWFSSRER